MRALTKIVLSFIILLVFFACERSESEIQLDVNEQDQIAYSAEKNIKLRRAKGIPFKAKFHTIRTYLGDNPIGCPPTNADDCLGYYEPVVCDESPFLDFNLQCGEGTGTHLGKFSTVMSFCGSGFDYTNGTGVFIAANGDELYFKVPSPGVVGHVLPYDHPLYEAQFQDPFIFDGGTGRFVGATGGGITNSFVDLFDEAGNFICNHQTDHEWTGTLILP